IAAIVLHYRDITEERALETRKQSNRDFLERISAVLSSSLDYKETIDRVVSLTLGFMGDWCSLDLVSEGGFIEQVAIGHVNLQPLERIKHGEPCYCLPGLCDPLSPVAKAISTGEIVVVPQLTTGMFAPAEASCGTAENDQEVCSYVAAPLK